MARYVVAPGRTITNAPQPPLGEGMTIPADLLKQWGEAGLAANLEIGAVISDEPPTPRKAGK